MKNWFDVVEPHRDIKEQRFSESVFAADLGDVVSGTAPPDYSDPYTFSRNTFFTVGITNLLQQVSRKLSEGEGPAVIEIQTPFGGGKTHALISIYHYIKNAEKISDHLPKGLKTISASIGVVVGTHLNPVEGRKVDGLTLNTLWGELAYQLGGEKAYKEFEENDTQRVAPGKEKLKELLIRKQPFILLFDEILEYIAKALEAKSSRGNLGGQTYAFLQELTETVASIDRGMFIVSLPSSVLEDYTGEKEQGLARLNKIFGRIETIEAPVKGDEIYSIIRKRLFQDVKHPSRKKETVHKYFEFYRNNKQDIPAKARELDFAQEMELAYPFHPDTIDLLYEKWGTFPSFQRTRGVLRLLANVIGDLYARQKNIDVILPCDINLNHTGIRREFLKHIGYEYESIIGSDIAGHQAKAQILDGENPQWKHLAERVATSIFLHSFTAEETEKGIDLPYIKMATMHLDTMPALVTEILQSRLTGSQGVLWYLNERDGRFYFSKIPSLRKIVRDKKELIKKDRYTQEIQKTVIKEAGKALSTYVWPQTSQDIPDNNVIKLIIADPKFSDSQIEQWTEKRGNNFRTYKNTMIFAIADTAAYGHLEDQTKEYIALQEIEKEISTGEWETLKGKLPEIKENIDTMEENLSYNLRKIYNTLYVGGDKIDLGMPTAAKENLSSWFKRELEFKEKIVRNLHYRMIIQRFMSDRDQLETKTILEQFYKNTELPMIEDENVLRRTIQKAVADGAFGLATIQDGEIDEPSFRYKKTIPVEDIVFDENEYVLSKEKVEKLICPQCGRLLINGTCSNTCPKCGTHLVHGRCPKCEIGVGPPERCEICGSLLVKGKCSNLCIQCGTHLVDGICPNTCRECGTHLIDGVCPKCGKEQERYREVTLRIEDVPTTKIADLNRGVLLPISREIGGFKVTLEIDITNEDGISKETIEKIVKETISQVGAKITKEKLK